MAIYRAQISFPVDGVLPADAMTITPHYQGDDAVALANMLKSNLAAFSPIGATKPFKIRIYDAEKAPPSYPLATAEQTGTPPSSSTPRELAMCLSYYSTYNRPRYRGRLYIPSVFIAGVPAARPSGAMITSVLGWHAPLAVGLPAQTTFSVYSRMDGKAYTVSDFWVDDEWDVVRSRGRKPTTRQTVDLFP
jgi:hypothetical protein